MDKRKLSKIPRPIASEQMIDMARELSETYLITTEMAENEILLLNFFEVAKLKQGKTEAAYRTFFSHEDYITQNLEVSNVKWITASLMNLGIIGYRDNGKDKKIFSLKEGIRLKKFFKSKEDDLWRKIEEFQNGVLKKRLGIKHDKEKNAIDRLMEPIKEPPKELKKWAFDVALGFSRYLVYKEIKKGKVECECTYCKEKKVLNRAETKLKDNEKGKCPFCGSDVIQKARGRLPEWILDERWIMYIEKYNEGVVLRYFKAFRKIDSSLEVSDKFREYCRTYYEFHNGEKIEKWSFEFAHFKQTSEVRWCKSLGKIPLLACCLYPVNLPKVWKDTEMKYSALEILSRNNKSQTTRYEVALSVYLNFPKLEWLIKMGLNNLVCDFIDGWHSIDTTGNTIYEILKLDKLNVRLLQEVNGNDRALQILQYAQKAGYRFKADELKRFYKAFGTDTSLIEKVNRKVTLNKILKYLENESKRYTSKDKINNFLPKTNRYYEICERNDHRGLNRIARDWKEYIGWCKDLGYDINNMFIYLPKGFKAVHDRTYREYQALLDKKAKAEKEKQEKLAKMRMEETKRMMKEIFSGNGESGAFQIRGKGLMIVVPSSLDDIKREGEVLHHCVGTYTERVAKGETNIFFVRKEKEPSVPYFTVEYKNGKVAQCRGSHNQGMPLQVEAFVKVFEQKMQDAERKRKAG